MYNNLFDFHINYYSNFYTIIITENQIYISIIDYNN